MVTMATLVWQIELQGLCIVKNITLHVSIEVLFLMTYCMSVRPVDLNWCIEFASAILGVLRRYLSSNYYKSTNY